LVYLDLQVLLVQPEKMEHLGLQVLQEVQVQPVPPAQLGQRARKALLVRPR
jgi:hypothetical protein